MGHRVGPRATCLHVLGAALGAVLASAASAQDGSHDPAIIEAPSLLPSRESAEADGSVGAVRAASEAGGADLITLTEGDAGGGGGLPVEAQIAPLGDVEGGRALAERIAATGITAEGAVFAAVILLPIVYWIWSFVARQRRRARRRRRARERESDYGWQ